MSYDVRCACEREISVSAAAAGGEVTCECGAVVTVPKLSELRRSAGKGAYETSEVDVISAMLRDGQLPWGNTCIHSTFPTEDVFDVSVQCQQCLGGDGGGGFLVAVLVGLVGGLAGGISAPQSELETHGHELVVYTPIRLCKEFHAQFRKASQRRLRRLLRSVPVFSRLLDEYPHARILPGHSPRS
jgi:hypothetical protein